MELSELAWNRPFNPAYGIVDMYPEKFVFYRGYDISYAPVSERPAYYGTLEDARSYGTSAGRTVSAFTNKKRLRLMDIRFMKALLRELFAFKEDENILSVVLSFGLCSLYHQCNLAKQRFTDPEILPSVQSLCKFYKESNYEQQGFRAAETSNDAYTMGFLTKLFEDFADGFFSPRQFSPFHKEKTDYMLNGELILFNPLKSGIIKLDTFPTVVRRYFVETLYATYGKGIHIGTAIMPQTVYVHQGGANESEQHIIEQISELLNHDPFIQDQWEKGSEAGLAWKAISEFKQLEGPHPECKVSDWNNELPKRRPLKLFSRRYTVKRKL